MFAASCQIGWLPAKAQERFWTLTLVLSYGFTTWTNVIVLQISTKQDHYAPYVCSLTETHPSASFGSKKKLKNTSKSGSKKHFLPILRSALISYFALSLQLCVQTGVASYSHLDITQNINEAFSVSVIRAVGKASVPFVTSHRCNTQNFSHANSRL